MRHCGTGILLLTHNDFERVELLNVQDPVATAELLSAESEKFGGAPTDKIGYRWGTYPTNHIPAG